MQLICLLIHNKGLFHVYNCGQYFLISYSTMNGETLNNIRVPISKYSVVKNLNHVEQRSILIILLFGSA